jgi:hypothetical protein
MEMWQRLGRLKISCDFAILGKVTRNRGRFWVVVASSEDDWHVVVICLTLTSKPRFTSPSHVLSRGIGREVMYSQGFYGFWGLGKEEVVTKVVV